MAEVNVDKYEFTNKYGTLCSELSEYWDGNNATGKEADDFNLAQRWLHSQNGLSLEVNIQSLRAVIAEARGVLARFDECASFVIDNLNLLRVDTPEQAREWLEKMIPIWEDVLSQVEDKWSKEGGGGKGCRS